MIKIEKMLFVDDDPICLFLNVTLAEEWGNANEVTSFQDAKEALTYVQEHYPKKTSCYKDLPDLIFLDIKMPGMDGFEFLDELDKLKNIDRNSFVIVLLTTSLHPADKEKAICRSNKVFTCLTKPLAEADLDNLLNDVQEWLSDTNGSPTYPLKRLPYR